ncbi:hypothetical protein AB0H12_24335 [Actinosynnema sp. NPDC023794]
MLVTPGEAGGAAALIALGREPLEALRKAHRLGHDDLVAFAVYNQAGVLLMAGDLGAAADTCREALRLVGDRNPGPAALVLDGLATALAADGRSEEAGEARGRAESIRTRPDSG